MSRSKDVPALIVPALILVGLTLGLLGSRWETVLGAALNLVGLVRLVAGLVRWTRLPKSRDLRHPVEQLFN